MMIQTATPAIEFYTTADGCRLAVRRWNADGPPLAHVVFLHGVMSHSGWYLQVAEHLRDAGLNVHFVDRRGSGLSNGIRGDVASWQIWIDDLVAYLKRIDSESTNYDSERAPIVLCGISWGGKLAAVCASLYPSLIDGIALICPGIFSPYLPGRLKRAVLTLPIPKRLKQCRVRIPLRRPELFTRSPKWQQYISEDPSSLHTVTWRFAQEDRRLTQYAQRSAPHIRCRLLMMLAGQDRIVGNEMTRTFFAKAAGLHKTLVEYTAASHTLEFDFVARTYFGDLTSWIECLVGNHTHKSRQANL